MSSFLWLRLLAHRWLGRRGQRVSSTRAAVAARRRVRPRLELLEDRTLPAVSTTGQLIDAINAGNNSGGATTITLAAKTTFDFTTPYDDTRNALPVITGNITIIGNGDTIERDSSATAAFRLFDVANGGSLTLQDLTLQGGLAQGNPFLGQASAEGGAVYSSGTLNLSGVTVEKNQTLGFDGANAASAAGMNGQDAYGGGIYIAGGSAGLSNDSLIQNSALGGFGGHGGNSNGGNGLSGGNGGEGAGGGLYVAASNVNLINDTLSANHVYGNKGGKGGNGGAGTGTHTFLGIIISAGKGGNGGDGGLGGTGMGGGLYAGSGSVAVTNTLIAENTLLAGTGGRGGTGGSAHTNGTSGVSGNAGNVFDPDVDGSVSSSDHNLIGNPSGSNGFSSAHGDILNPSFLGLGPLANNGGPTQTMALLPGSPAINAGDNTAQSATGLYDQRGKGFVRVANGTIDIGAFEIQRRLVLAPPDQGSGSTPSSAPPPTLHAPPLLGFFDSLLAGAETVNSNGTETVVDSFFGIPLLVSTYDGAGNLMSATLFGIDITFLIEML